jgi:hypothetical protein
MASFTGLWSLPPNWLNTPLVVFLERSSVAKARFGVEVVCYLREKKVGGMFWASICQSSTSYPLLSVSS